MQPLRLKCGVNSSVMLLAYKYDIDMAELKLI